MYIYDSSNDPHYLATAGYACFKFGNHMVTIISIITLNYKREQFQNLLNNLNKYVYFLLFQDRKVNILPIKIFVSAYFVFMLFLIVICAYRTAVAMLGLLEYSLSFLVTGSFGIYVLMISFIFSEIGHQINEEHKESKGQNKSNKNLETFDQVRIFHRVLQSTEYHIYSVVFSNFWHSFPEFAIFRWSAKKNEKVFVCVKFAINIAYFFLFIYLNFFKKIFDTSTRAGVSN